MQIREYPKDPEQTVREAAPTPLHALRRKELEKVLVYNGLRIEGGATAEFMLIQLQEAQNQGMEIKAPPSGWKLQDHLIEQKPVEIVREPEPGPFAPEPYESMKLTALRKLVKRRGLKQTLGEPAASLIEKLHGQDASERNE